MLFSTPFQHLEKRPGDIVSTPLNQVSCTNAIYCVHTKTNMGVSTPPRSASADIATIAADFSRWA